MLEREVAFMFVCGFERVVQWLGTAREMGPNENSVTCERYMSKDDVSLDVGGEGRTYGYGLHVYSSHNHGRG